MRKLDRWPHAAFCLEETHTSETLVFDGLYGDSVGLLIPLVVSSYSRNLTPEGVTWNVCYLATGFWSVCLAFWRCGEETSLWRQRTQNKANSATDKPSETRKHCLQKGKDARSVGGSLAGEVITLNNTPTQASIASSHFSENEARTKAKENKCNRHYGAIFYSWQAGYVYSHNFMIDNFYYLWLSVHVDVNYPWV